MEAVTTELGISSALESTHPKEKFQHENKPTETQLELIKLWAHRRIFKYVQVHKM